MCVNYVCMQCNAMHVKAMHNIIVIIIMLFNASVNCISDTIDIFHACASKHMPRKYTFCRSSSVISIILNCSNVLASTPAALVIVQEIFQFHCCFHFILISLSSSLSANFSIYIYSLLFFFSFSFSFSFPYMFFVVVVVIPLILSFRSCNYVFRSRLLLQITNITTILYCLYQTIYFFLFCFVVFLIIISYAIFFLF